MGSNPRPVQSINSLTANCIILTKDILVEGMVEGVVKGEGKGNSKGKNVAVV